MQLKQSAEVLSILLLLTGCDTAGRIKDGLAVRHTAHATAAPQSKRKATLQISEISIERNPGLTNGSSPSYTLTVRSDGTATYSGTDAIWRKGTYITSISATDFALLVHGVEESHFFSDEPFYGFGGEDVPYTLVSVKRDGRRRTIIDYAGSSTAEHIINAPTSLKALETQIDGVVADAWWIKSSGEICHENYVP